MNLTPFLGALCVLQLTPSAAAGQQAPQLERAPRPASVHYEDIKTPGPTLTPRHLKTVPTRPGGHGPVERTVPLPSSPQAFQQAQGMPHTIERVYVDQPQGSDYWVRGSSYKARFGADGVDYIPFLGSDAPRNYPVTFTLVSAQAGGQDLTFATGVPASYGAGAMTFDRGALLERYLIELDSIEQTFVFEDAVSGEIVVRVGVTTDLTPNDEGAGFRFENELGAVLVSDAIAVDAKGNQVELASDWDGESFTLRVPAAFTASATFPLTIDPILTTFAIDTFGAELTFPKTAYDPGTDSFLTAYNENFSATDGDIYATRHTIDGTFLNSAYIDSTSDRWVSPDVGCVHSADSFLVAATRDMGSATAKRIWGRIWTPSSDVQGMQFLISTSFIGDKSSPSVGGDPFDDFLVIWEREFTSTDHDIHGRLVTSSGVPVGPTSILIDNSTIDDTNPDCSKFNGMTPAATSSWGVVWERDNAGTTEIWGAELLYDGSITHSSYPIYTGGLDASFPYVSSPLDKVGDRTFLATFNIDFGSDVDAYASAVQGGVVIAQNNLSVGDLPGSFLDDEFNPRADGNSMRFCTVWNDGMIGAFTSNHVSTVNLVDGSLCVTETSTLNSNGDAWPTDVAASTLPDFDPDYLVVMYDTSGSSGNIGGAHYDDYWGCVGLEFCGGTAVPNSSGLWGQIYGLGSGIAGDSLTLYAHRLPPNQFGYFLVSRTSGLTMPPGSQGTLCLNGNIGRYNTLIQNTGAQGRMAITVGTNSIPINPPVAAVAGDTFLFQGWHRDLNPGVTSNFTDGLSVTFQ